MVDVSLYGQGLYVVPIGRKAQLVQTKGGLVAESGEEVTDDMIFGLVDAIRR